VVCTFSHPFEKYVLEIAYDLRNCRNGIWKPFASGTYGKVFHLNDLPIFPRLIRRHASLAVYNLVLKYQSWTQTEVEVCHFDQVRNATGNPLLAGIVVDSSDTTQAGLVLYRMSGTLLDYLNAFIGHRRPYGGRLNEIIRRVVKEIARLHRHKLGHRDIKVSDLLLCSSTPSDSPQPANILIEWDERYHVRHLYLTDFGTLARLSTDGYADYKEFVGTHGYCPPEASSPGRHNVFKHDSFALGAIFFEMVFRRRAMETSNGGIQPPAPRNTGSRWLDNLLGDESSRCCVIEIDDYLDRYPGFDATVLLELAHLERLYEPLPEVARPAAPTVAAGAVAAPAEVVRMAVEINPTQVNHLDQAAVALRL